MSFIMCHLPSVATSAEQVYLFCTKEGTFYCILTSADDVSIGSITTSSEKIEGGGGRVAHQILGGNIVA